MQSVEDFVDAAVATLRAGLDGQLAEIEAEYAGGPYELSDPLPRPKFDGGPNDLGDFWPGGVGEIIRYPTIEVALPDLSGDTFSIDQHESDVTAVVIIRAWLQHAKFTDLYRICCRYGAAMHNLLCDPDEATGRGSGFGASTTIRRYTAHWRFNPETNERDEVTSAVLLAYWLDAPDVRP